MEPVKGLRVNPAGSGLSTVYSVGTPCTIGSNGEILIFSM